jgi:predicted nucleic-acid-binding Zn-ribbon protein
MSEQDHTLTPCPRCQGERVLTRVQGVQQQIVVIQSGFDPPHSPLVALTCLTCGLTEFYASHPENLRR